MDLDDGDEHAAFGDRGLPGGQGPVLGASLVRPLLCRDRQRGHPAGGAGREGVAGATLAARVLIPDWQKAHSRRRPVLGVPESPYLARPSEEGRAHFHATCERLTAAGFEIWSMPVEVPNPIQFEADFEHASYDAEYANRFWRALVKIDEVLKSFRAEFIGKVSPVHFFWGSFDMAVTRFSGRPAPERPDADLITREAYSHEVISHGFWPGNKDMEAAFYSYTAPEPAGLADAKVLPAATFYSKEQKEFFLLYEEVRKPDSSGSPEKKLSDFLRTT